MTSLNDLAQPAPTIFAHRADGGIDVLCRPCEITLVEGFDDGPEHRDIVQRHRAGHGYSQDGGSPTLPARVDIEGYLAEHAETDVPVVRQEAWVMWGRGSQHLPVPYLCCSPLAEVWPDLIAFSRDTLVSALSWGPAVLGWDGQRLLLAVDRERPPRSVTTVIRYRPLGLLSYPAAFGFDGPWSERDGDWFLVARRDPECDR